MLEAELDETESIPLNEETAKQTCVNFITQNFTFINGTKLIDPLWDFSNEITQKIAVENHGYGFEINLVLHTVGMIERILLNEPLSVEQVELEIAVIDPLFQTIQQILMPLEKMIRFETPLSEVYYLLKLIHNELSKNGYTN